MLSHKAETSFLLCLELWSRGSLSAWSWCFVLLEGSSEECCSHKCRHRSNGDIREDEEWLDRCAGVAWLVCVRRIEGSRRSRFRSQKLDAGKLKFFEFDCNIGALLWFGQRRGCFRG